uniref:Pecanex-like protein n=1 Tax=Gongylonema pulchrum TaxID=637853 RepID=A0A183DDA8_9BILA
LLERRINLFAAPWDDAVAAAVARSIASSVSSRVVAPSQARMEIELSDIVFRSVSTDEVTSNSLNFPHLEYHN